MTTSTCSTVSTEEVTRFAAEMAEQLGLTRLLGPESWADPHARPVPLPDSPCKLRNSHLRLRLKNE